MVKVKGPLFSVSASGTFLDTVEFRTGSGLTVAAKTRSVSHPRTSGQQAQSQRFGRAVVAWRSLTPAQRDEWNNAGGSPLLNGYQKFVSEYQHQNIVPPNLPIPP